MDVLTTVAKNCGLDLDELKESLDDGRYLARVSQGSEEAKRMGVTAVPSFYVEDLQPITGAVHEDTFREVLQSISTS